LGGWGQAQVAALSLAKESGADWGWAKMLVLPPFFAPVKRHGKGNILGQNHVTFQHGFESFGPTRILEVKHSTRSLPIGSVVIV